MEDIVEHIGNEAASVDGLNGKKSTEDGLAASDLKRRLSMDTPDAKRTKTSDVTQPATEEIKEQDEQTDSAPVVVVDKNGENGTAAAAASSASGDVVAPVVSTIETNAVVTAAEDLPDSIPATVMATKDNTDMSNGNVAIEDIPELVDTSVVADDSATDDPSVVDLDTSLETSVVVEAQSTTTGDDDENDTAVVEADSVANADTDTEPLLKELEVESTEEAMDVTVEDKDKTLETPNVSVCPAERPPQLGAPNHRVSELVLSNGSSTPNTSNPTSVEFQATPIKKPDDGSVGHLEEEKVLTDGSSSQYSVSSDTKSKSSLDAKVEAGMKCLREITELANGPSTTDCSSAQSDVEEKVVDLTQSASLSSPELFDTAVNFHNGTLQCLIVERVIKPITIPSDLSDAASEKSTSNGSTTSLGPFALPTLTHTHSGLSVSSTSSASARPFISPASDNRRVEGVSGLKAFLQELLKKLPEEEKKKPGRATKPKPLAASARPVPEKRDTPATVAFVASESQVGNFVMARWTDKKFYAGRVSAEKPGNKYLINFEDGANKTLSRDQIVFGNKTVVPLLNYECNVLTEPNVYETGLVVAIDAEAATYNVMTNSGTVTVLASDIYLDEDQAKLVRLSYADEESARNSLDAPATSGRRKRNSDVLTSSPKAGTSTASEAKKFKKRQPPLQFQSNDTQLSDLSDTFDSEPAKVPEVPFIEAVDGVQPELNKCPIQAKINLTCGYYKDDLDEDKLGNLPTNAALFRDRHVILTATSVPNPAQESQFCDYPFVMEHLVKQLQCGGATVYGHFEDIPKTKHKSCILITRYPCLTARYIQCLAANLTIVHHGWVIDSCLQNRAQDLRSYTLPAGYSMLENNFVRYVTGRNEKRSQARPFSNLTILLSSDNADFINFWTRVCKYVDAKVVKAINSVLDITNGKRTYMVTESEVIIANVEKAKAVGIPIVSTAWVAECLIQGKLLQPDDHANFTKANWDLQS